MKRLKSRLPVPSPFLKSQNISTQAVGLCFFTKSLHSKSQKTEAVSRVKEFKYKGKSALKSRFLFDLEDKLDWIA